jgi:hypothetical protein
VIFPHHDSSYPQAPFEKRVRRGSISGAGALIDPRSE